MIFYFVASFMDFDHTSHTLMFGACKNTLQCTEIVIVDDTIVELSESFSVTLERTAGLDSRITLVRVDGEIEIIDNDGVYIIIYFSLIWIIWIWALK